MVKRDAPYLLLWGERKFTAFKVPRICPLLLLVNACRRQSGAMGIKGGKVNGQRTIWVCSRKKELRNFTWIL